MSTGSAEVAVEVLAFWRAAGAAKWFKKDAVFDAEIASRFSALWRDAAEGVLANWEAAPESALALVILLDQFPRNLFRESGRAFATDALAFDAAQRMATQGWDERLNTLERQFAYLPFEHAEDINAQRPCLRLFGKLGHADLLEWARKHCDIIERFGRFPHRNAVLGRESTPDEIEFLKQPGSRF